MTRVHIELARVQSWLFSVPRLRAMVGANVLLGETLRDNLDACAMKTNGLAPEVWTASSSDVPSVDPLGLGVDNPIADAARGVLARDGGHFEASFQNRDSAEAFVRSATRVLRRETPGLRFSVKIDRESVPESAPRGVSMELPHLAACEWSGRDIASVDVRQGSESSAVSLDVEKRWKAAKRFRDGNARDIASRLLSTTRLKEWVQPVDFGDLAGGGYLGVIHADGNGVGGDNREAAGDDLQRQQLRFWRSRILVRAAVRHSINSVCRDAEAKLPAGRRACDTPAPLVLLMLGGDDLLIVCRAQHALPFVVELCSELARLQDGQTLPLTLGVGVVIARRTMPFHRLHAIAERLVDSAKRRVRSTPAASRASVVDWAVYTDSWAEDPVQVRRRDWIVAEPAGTRLVLSDRPLTVLGKSLRSLQGLCTAASVLDAAPRSQLRYLVDQMRNGRSCSELALAELSPRAASAVAKSGVLPLWQHAGTDLTTTSLLDLVEAAEIPRLGATASDVASEPEEPVGDDVDEDSSGAAEEDAP